MIEVKWIKYQKYLNSKQLGIELKINDQNIVNPKSNYDEGSEISEPQVDLKFTELQLGIRNFLTLSNYV